MDRPSPSDVEQPDLDNYLDYRAYLRAQLVWLKANDRKFNQRKLAEAGGFGLGLFTKVVQGERDISARMVVRFAEALGLNAADEEKFETLVLYNQARTPSEKLERLKELMAQRARSRPVCTLEERQYQFYAEWIHSAVREVIACGGFQGDYQALGAALTPPIGVRAARRSVKLLCELGLVREVGEGKRWEVADQLITTGNEMAATALRGFNHEMIRLGREALDRFGPNERNISTVSFSVAHDRFPLLVERVRAFRREIMEMAASDAQADQAYQLNLQLFPLSGRLPTEGQP